MVVGHLGPAVVSLVVLELRQEHAQIHHQQMEDLTVLDLQVNLVTHKHVLQSVILFYFILTVHLPVFLTIWL